MKQNDLIDMNDVNFADGGLGIIGTLGETSDDAATSAVSTAPTDNSRNHVDLINPLEVSQDFGVGTPAPGAATSTAPKEALALSSLLSSGKTKHYLSDDFCPSEFDVICGRGKDCYNHSGNRRFRMSIDMSLQSYTAADTKLQKSLIVMSIVDMFQKNSRQGGGFVRQERGTGRWYRIADEAAREKVGQTIREAVVQQDPKKRAQKRMKRAMNKAKKNTGTNIGKGIWSTSGTTTALRGNLTADILKPPSAQDAQPETTQEQNKNQQQVLQCTDMPPPLSKSLASLFQSASSPSQVQSPQQPQQQQQQQQPIPSICSLPRYLQSLQQGQQAQQLAPPAFQRRSHQEQVNSSSSSNNGITQADEMLAAIPPSLVLESSRDWFTPPSGDTTSVSTTDDWSVDEDEFDSVFDMPTNKPKAPAGSNGTKKQPQFPFQLGFLGM